MSRLVVDGLSHGFSRGGRDNRRWVQLLDRASFDVLSGEVVAIIGGWQSGKTALLSFSAGLKVPEAGSVELGGTELTTLSNGARAELRQDGLIWVNRAGMSQKLEVAKIVGWPLATRGRGRREAERRAAEMLERVGALHCAQQRWDDLSRWEQVMVGLAQSFAVSRPTLVVIDDLLDALGEPATQQASDLLRSLIEDADRSCGVLASVSDDDSGLYANRTWTLESGKLIPTRGHGATEAIVVPLRRGNEDEGSRRVGRR